MANYCRARFATPKGSFDAYLVFLERGLQLLAPHGRLGFIVPNKVFKLDFAERMRNVLAREELVEEVLDFGASQLFAGVTNYTCIAILDRSGKPELAYRRLRGSREEILSELTAGGTIPAQAFAAREFGREPWVLVPPEEAEVIRVARTNADRLEDVTSQIFQGLITSADAVYVLDDRGQRGAYRVVWSRASSRELELEPDLLHPLASGVDVDRYAFRQLSSLLLFPYVEGDEGMRLVSERELDALPRTREYLKEHEELLRRRESGKMDHDDWYGYVYPKNLAAHELRKLGVPRLCRRLRASLDDAGDVYFDNVDVNGILLTPDGPSPFLLVLLLNSRLIDWIFRRHSVPFQNEYWSANRQFIAGLPVRAPEASAATTLETLGRRLHGLASAIASERGNFAAWLRATLGVAPGVALPGQRVLGRFELATADEVVRALAAGRRRLGVDPRERDVRELIEREHRRSVDGLLPLISDLSAAEDEADAYVYELYEIPARMRELVDREYD